MSGASAYSAVAGGCPPSAGLVCIVEPLARSTGHQSWFAGNIVNAMVESGIAPLLITFDGMHEDADLALRDRGCDVRRISTFVPSWLKWIFGRVTGIEQGKTAAPSAVRWPFQMYLYNQIAVAVSVLYACRAKPLGGPHIVHILSPPSWVALHCLSLARRHGAKAVITAYDAPGQFKGSSALIQRLCSESAVTILVQTETMALEWVRRVGPNSVRLIPLPSGKAFAGDRLEARRLLDLPENMPIVAVIGNIGPRKGYIELFRAVKDLPKDFRILLVGDTGPWTSPDPREVAQEAGWLENTIIRRQFVPERLIPALFTAVNSVALLYREPNVSSGILSLCQQYGVPVIATRFGEIGSKVRRERLGLTVDPNDPPGVAEAVSRILGSANDWRARYCDTNDGQQGTSEPTQAPSWLEAGVAHLQLYAELGDSCPMQ